jgi:hypothetical protein
VIGDLHETIKQMLVEGVPLDLSEIDVAFDKPDSEWSSSLSRPTINCYLYHVIENHDLRQTDWQINRPILSKEPVKRGEHRMATRRRLPFRMDHFFMVTAWANEIEDEHRLLWRIMVALMRFNNGNIPPEKLQGELFGQEWPIPMKVAQADTPIKNPTDFWSSMEVAVKPSVNMVVTLPLDPELIITTPLVITRRAMVYPDMYDREKMELPGLEIGGWVWSGEEEDARTVPGAEVLMVERGTTSITDEEGRFRFDYVPYGQYTLRTTVEGRQAERRVELPGEDYDLVLGTTAGTQGRSASEDSSSSDKREGGKGRRR